MYPRDRNNRRVSVDNSSLRNVPNIPEGRRERGREIPERQKGKKERRSAEGKTRSQGQSQAGPLDTPLFLNSFLLSDLTDVLTSEAKISQRKRKATVVLAVLFAP